MLVTHERQSEKPMIMGSFCWVIEIGKIWLASYHLGKEQSQLYVSTLDSTISLSVHCYDSHSLAGRIFRQC
jgi:hypothetical protein